MQATPEDAGRSPPAAALHSHDRQHHPIPSLKRRHDPSRRARLGLREPQAPGSTYATPHPPCGAGHRHEPFHPTPRIVLRARRPLSANSRRGRTLAKAHKAASRVGPTVGGRSRRTTLPERSGHDLEANPAVVRGPSRTEAVTSCSAARHLTRPEYPKLCGLARAPPLTLAFTIQVARTGRVLSTDRARREPTRCRSGEGFRLGRSLLAPSDHPSRLLATSAFAATRSPGAWPR
jgi:hypothetical protein